MTHWQQTGEGKKQQLVNRSTRNQTMELLDTSHITIAFCWSRMGRLPKCGYHKFHFSTAGMPLWHMLSFQLTITVPSFITHHHTTNRCWCKGLQTAQKNELLSREIFLPLGHHTETSVPHYLSPWTLSHGRMSARQINLSFQTISS